MARLRRRFVGSLVVDGVATSYLVLAALLHATRTRECPTNATGTSGAGDTDGVGAPEMAPFIGHIGHGFIALLGLGGIWLPGSSFFPRALRLFAMAAFFGDAVSVATHAMTLSAERMMDDCAVYTLLAILLAASALNVYWTSTGELSTFDVIDHVERQQRQR